MATEAELIEQKREERKKLLDEVTRRRAAAARSEGIIGAAEEGQYGDVGQGGPKGEFDDEINQDPGNEDPSQSSMTQQAKNFLANYFTNAKFGATGAGIEGMARIQAFLADKKIPFTDKDLTDIFMLVSQAPNRETFTKEDIGKVIGMGEFVTEDMVGKNKPLTIGQVPGYLGNLLFGGTAEDMRKVRDEGLTVDEMTPGQRASMAAGFSEFTPFGFAPDIYRIGKSGVKAGVKAIDEMITPLNQMQTAGGPNVNMMGNLSEAPLIQTSKTSTKTDPTAPGRSKLGTIKYGDKEIVKDQVSRYNEAVEKINNLKENVFNITADSSPEAIEAAGKAYKKIVEGNDDVLKIALGNNIKTSGYKSQGDIIQTASGINKKEFLDFKNKHPLRSGNSLNKALRLNSAVKLLEDYRKANPKSLGIEINFRKLKEILGESEEFKNIFADIPVEVLDAKKISSGKNLTREEKYIESVLNNYQADFVTIEKYLQDLGFDLARPFKYRDTGKIGATGKRITLKLNEDQTKIFSNKRKEIQEILKEIQTVPIGKDGMGASTKVKDFLKTTTERMKAQGASETDIIKAVKNIDSNELAKLILKREEANLQKLNNLQEYEEIAKAFGDNPPQESLFNYQLGHIKALEDSIESSLDMNNLMIQTEYANKLDNEVRNYVKNKIKQLNELSPNDPRDAVLRQRLIDDLEQIDEIAKEEGVFTMIEGKEIGDKTKSIVKESDFPKDESLFMKAGGMVGISHLTRPL